MHVSIISTHVLHNRLMSIYVVNYQCCRLRKIAHSATENEYKMNVDNLKKSAHWKNSTFLQKWFEGKWLSNAKVHLYDMFSHSDLNTIPIIQSK